MGVEVIISYSRANRLRIERDEHCRSMAKRQPSRPIGNEDVWVPGLALPTPPWDSP